MSNEFEREVRHRRVWTTEDSINKGSYIVEDFECGQFDYTSFWEVPTCAKSHHILDVLEAES